MGLREYFKKRSFGKTPEPKDRSKGATSGHHKLRFVVQEHHATARHYDFRLEIDGVLKSWAVPKGPSLNPHDHHLAIKTEDHPYAYRTFEGVIPEDNYGAGNVIIWDEGTYVARKGPAADSEKTLRSELKAGHLTFVLHGKKLKGEFALIKLPHTKEDDAWLLIKKTDAFASSEDITAQDESIKSHLRVDELGAHNKLPDLSDYPTKTKPWQVSPMLCTLTQEPFDREGWLFEVKWDGYRAIASRRAQNIELYSRNHLDFRSKYPPVAEALRDIDHDVILDGEIVVVDDDGKPHFEWLQNWHRELRGTLRYYAFDILWCDGHDVRMMPLRERKGLLRSVLPTHSDVLRFGDDLATRGTTLFHEMQRRGLEGIVAKRADSPYRENARGQDWLKIKTHLRQEVVIGGYTEPRGSRKYLGSLLVGVYDHDELVYTGHSGGGIPDEDRKRLQARLARLERKTSPFSVTPKPNAPVHWVKPELVCEMEFTEWTSDGSMRHPEFKGLRVDKKPHDVRREKSKSTSRSGASLVTPSAPSSSSQAAGEVGAASSSIAEPGETTPRLGYTRPQAVASARSGNESPRRGVVSPGSDTPKHATQRQWDRLTTPLRFTPTHLDKIFFPKHKITKGDLMSYYTAVAPHILPYLDGRPLSLNRMPDGINGMSFFQKNNEHLPDWVPHAAIFSDSNKANLRWIVGGQLETLLYLVQLGSIEINPWNSRVGRLDRPDWIVIDLDPEGVGFEKVIEVAQTVHEVCKEWGIDSYPKTSGKTGLHIYIPMGAKYSYEQSKNLAHLIALEVNKRQPKITSVERMPAKRKRKIYLDFLQNREGQTLAAPYSVRPTPDATVSMPLRWSEVKAGLKPTDFTIQNASKRIKSIGDPWKPVLNSHIDLPKIVKVVEAQSKS